MSGRECSRIPVDEIASLCVCDPVQGVETQMRPRALGTLLVTVAVFAVACLSGDSQQPSPTAVETTFVQTTASTDPTTTTGPSADGTVVEAYLVEMSNLAADLGIQLSDFECSYNEQFSLGFCTGSEEGGGFVEEGEEFEKPPEPPEEKLFEYQRGYWSGTFDIHLAHADVLEGVVPPYGFESVHQDYANSYRAYFTYLNDQVTVFSDVDELFEFLNAFFDPLAEVPPELEELLLAMVESCGSLEDLGSEAGLETNLDCPTPPTEAISVDIEADDVWSANPNQVPIGDGLVQMTITNTSAEQIRPVVLEVFAGDPLDLPVIDGMVDISRSGEFDPASGYAEFYVHYAGENWEVTGEPLELSPGESVEAAIWSEQTLVVFDYRPGEFEAGAFAVVERSGS